MLCWTMFEEVNFSGVFFIYSGITLFVFFFCLIFIPETTDVGIEDVELLLMTNKARPSALQNRSNNKTGLQRQSIGEFSKQASLTLKNAYSGESKIKAKVNRSRLSPKQWLEIVRALRKRFDNHLHTIHPLPPSPFPPPSLNFPTPPPPTGSLWSLHCNFSALFIKLISAPFRLSVNISRVDLPSR